MFRSFVLFIAANYYILGCNVFSYFLKFLNFYVTFFIVTYYLAVSRSVLLLFTFSLVISYFSYFKFVTFQTRVILCNTLNKEGLPSETPILCNQTC